MASEDTKKLKDYRTVFLWGLQRISTLWNVEPAASCRREESGPGSLRPGKSHQWALPDTGRNRVTYRVKLQTLLMFWREPKEHAKAGTCSSLRDLYYHVVLSMCQKKASASPGRLRCLWAEQLVHPYTVSNVLSWARTSRQGCSSGLQTAPRITRFHRPRNNEQMQKMRQNVSKGNT